MGCEQARRLELKASLQEVQEIMRSDAAAVSAARQSDIDTSKEKLAGLQVQLQMLQGMQQQEQSHLASLQQVCPSQFCGRASPCRVRSCAAFKSLAC